MDGYFKLQRRFFKHWLWDQERVYSQSEAFLDLLQLAAFAPTKRVVKRKLIFLEPGELIASLRFLAVRWQWGKDKTRSFLKMLESDSMIRRETRQGESVIILCNYNKYAHLEEHPPDSKPDRGQTEARQRPDSDPTNKKKDKKDKKDNPTTPTPAVAWSREEGWSGISEHDRDEWKQAYPACDLNRQLAAASLWLKANPAKARKKNWHRFLVNWLARAQEKGGDVASNPAETNGADDYRSRGITIC